MEAELRKTSKRLPAAAEQPTPSDNLTQVGTPDIIDTADAPLRLVLY